MDKAKSRRIIFVLLLLTIISLIPLRTTRFEFAIEKLFPRDDVDLAVFEQFQEQFNSRIDDEFILIGLNNQQGIFRQDFLVKTDSLTNYISRLENIIKVYSLTSTSLIYFQNEEINARPLLHITQPELYKEDSAYLFASAEYRDLLISKDGRSIAIAAFNKQFLTDDQKDILLNAITTKIKELEFDEFHLTAKIRVERIYVKEIQKNLAKYLIVSLALISLVLFILFKSVKAIIIPLLIIAVSIIWTLSVIALTGHPLDIISSLIPPILAAICMSDIIHISTHYIENLRAGLPKNQALKKTFREIGLATFYTCCIVATGFFTLGITDIIPIRNFGFFAGLGLFIAFGITLLTLRSYYTLSPAPEVVHDKLAERRWHKFLAFSFKKIIKNKWLVLAVCTAIAASSIYFIKKVEVNSSLLQEIPKKNPVLDDYKFMETDFAGTRPFELELTFTGQNTTFFDIQNLLLIEKIERFIKDSCGVGNLISPLSLFRGANKAFYAGNNDYFTLPNSQEQVIRFYEAISQTEHADEMHHYLSEDARRLRISGRLPNLTIKEFEQIENKFDSFFKKRDLDRTFTYHSTGSAVLLDKITYSLTKNLFTGVLIDAIIISLIAFLLLRQWRIILIVLIPNIFPLLVMGAAMGILKINLKADTAVIFTIAFGIAADDTIHFLSRLRLELSKGLTLPYAVKRTYLSTGKAIVITTLVLLSGFMTLLSSSFGGAFYIGLLISLCLLTASIMELTLTPVLVLLFYKKKEQDINS